MAFCGKCGTKVDEGVKFCPGCGAPMREAQQTTEQAQDAQQQQTNAQNDFSAKIAGLNNTADNTADFDPQDIANNKAMGILAYLSWLVLIPIFGAKGSKYARFHANQGLVLAITEVIWWVAEGILSSVLWSLFGYRLWSVYSLLTTVLGLVNIVFVILLVIGIMNAVNGRAKELPIIGKFKILK